MDQIGQTFNIGNKEILCSALSYDGQTLVTLDQDYGVSYWNMTTQKQNRSLSTQVSNEEGRPLAFSPDLKTLAYTDSNGHIIVLDLATNHLQSTLVAYPGAVGNIVFSSDGKLLAAEDGRRGVVVWDIDSGLPDVQVLEGHTDEVSSLAFSPDEKVLTSIDKSDTTIEWDVTTGATISVQPGNGSFVEPIPNPWSPNQKYILVTTQHEK